MGEARRRKKHADAEDARVVACSYRRGPALYVIHGAEDDEPEISCYGIADAIRAPNAMRPKGIASGAGKAADDLADSLKERAAAEGRSCAFDADGNYLAAFDERQGSIPGLERIDHGLGIDVYVRSDGEVLTVSSSRALGLLGADGAPVADPRALMDGLVRTDSRGTPLVPADAPISVQFAALCDAAFWEDPDQDGDAPGGDRREALDSIHAHISQLLDTTVSLAASPALDPATWIDLSALRDATGEYADGNMPDVDEVQQNLLARLDGSRPDAPHWKLPMLGQDPDDWVPRDRPGAGLSWKEFDARFAAAFPEMPSGPSTGAEWAHLGPEFVGDARALLAGARHVARKGRDSLSLDEGRGMYLCLMEDARAVTLVTWPVDDNAEARLDPLMAGELKGLDALDHLSPIHAFGARAEGIESFRSLGLLEMLPEPDVQPDYPILALADAVSRGLGIPDLLASLAAAIREGHADAAFWDEAAAGPGGHEVQGTDGDEEPAGDDPLELSAGEAGRRDAVASLAESLCGTPDPVLTAMFRGVEGDDWSKVDLGRDVRLLKDAWTVGCGLSDLTVTVQQAWLETYA